MGGALDRGMVLVLSLWDDTVSSMLWLDSAAGKGGERHPGVLRGPCPTSSGKPMEVRAKYPGSSVMYTNFMYGELDSTYTAGSDAKPEHAEKDNKDYAAALRRYKAGPPANNGGASNFNSGA